MPVAQSVVHVPCADDQGTIWEDTRLLGIDGADVAKTEYNLPDAGCSIMDARGKAGGVNATATFARDVLLSFGWSMARDAASLN